MMNIQNKGFAPLHDRAGASPTLPGYLYSDPKVFEAEKEQLFYRSWQLVGHVSEMKKPGDYITAEIVDQNIFIMRGRDGVLRAFYNVCQHRAHELLKGKGSIKHLIVCPYHAWAYEPDGALRTARNCEGMEAFDKADFGLKPVRLEEVLGFLFVNLDPEARPFAETHADMIAEIAAKVPWLDELEINPAMSAGAWDGSALKANWKILAENCLECYHCAPAHPAFVTMIDIDSYRVEKKGGWLRSYGGIKAHDNKAYNFSPDEPVQDSVFWHVWPNIEFSVFPGEASLGAFRFYPTSAGQTRMMGMTLTRPGYEIPKDRINYRWNVLWPEDEGLCESVHRGLQSKGYSQGRFVVDPNNPGIGEQGVHAFQAMYLDAMDGKI